MPRRKAAALDGGLLARKGEAAPAKEPAAVPHGTKDTVALTVRLDRERYQRLLHKGAQFMPKKSNQEMNERLLDTQQHLAETTRQIGATQRLALRLQTFAMVLTGLGLLLLALVAWQSLAVLDNTQIIAAHTRELLERFSQEKR